MGTDDLFHKRRARSAKQVSRRRARRDPYDKVLIVCEGEKTEPHYFNGVKDYYGLNGANVEITGECGSDPLSVVSHAKQRYREERDAGDPFDKVFCVFDKDAHPNYQGALNQIKQFTPKGALQAVTSVPCFEYWLLLHFGPNTRPYANLPGNSAGAQVLKQLQNYMPAYTKGTRGVFAELIDQLPFAIANAERALRQAEGNNTDNPSTHIHTLVQYLQTLKGGSKA
ncbi:RloB family protein [Gilvimarinus xylanilyticus]|uniref:RloB family protein n=1 Tax=Gilvimarinus xylanilyticus TaxID=2944139 RepID=A0A9X2HVN6_9GAMM|nr:RloB family protein [Gilvimarinus xylanilyticus]MCP8899268.1 RloB family protein [Gilvimarinus xylanilyticus]